MTIQNKRPEYIETVGAQYICFATASQNPLEFSGTYEANVEKTETVKKISVKENTETTSIHASGKVYANSSKMESVEITVDAIAFDRETLIKMRGETVGSNGLILGGGNAYRPYFAYGKTVKLSNGKCRYDWFPKCQLIENSDDAETSEGKNKEQNESITIRAMPFDDAENTRASVDTQIAVAKAITEEKFFAKPITKDSDLAVSPA